MEFPPQWHVFLLEDFDTATARTYRMLQEWSLWCRWGQTRGCWTKSGRPRGTPRCCRQRFPWTASSRLRSSTGLRRISSSDERFGATWPPGHWRTCAPWATATRSRWLEPEMSRSTKRMSSGNCGPAARGRGTFHRDPACGHHLGKPANGPWSCRASRCRWQSWVGSPHSAGNSLSIKDLYSTQLAHEQGMVGARPQST